MCELTRPIYRGQLLQRILSLFALSAIAGTAHADLTAKMKKYTSAPRDLAPLPTFTTDTRGELANPDKARIDAAPTASTSEPFELLPTGYRRTTRFLRLPLEAKLREALQRSGKTAEIDAVTGERIVRSIVDHLPEQWGMAADGDVAVNSLGQPIANATPGLPGWTQADVDALRTAIGHWLTARTDAAARGQDLTEIDGILGNYVGQALVRGIAIVDLVNLSDRSVISDAAAQSIIGYLHYYESLKFVHAEDGGYVYQSTVYSDEIKDFVASRGAILHDVLSVELDQVAGPRGDPVPSCYEKTAFARGVTLLSGATDIWNATGDDDAAADVSTGFPLFFFYDCEDGSINDSVRVSTNGYLTFFQRGGDTLDGTIFSNVAIPDESAPDGFIAPWWDDLIVASAQGAADRVSYKTEGAVDQRVFTVEWASISRLNGIASDYHSFQVKLYETTDVVELHFGQDGANWMTDTNDNSTTGIEAYSGGAGECGTNCQNDNNAAPTNNYRFTPTPRPTNDSCADAMGLANGAGLVGSLQRATADGAAGCGSSNNNRDLWFKFTAVCNGTFNVNTCGSYDINGAGTGIDSVLSLHSACPGTSINQLACSDDAGGTGCATEDSAVSTPMTIGQQVFIRVSHFGDSAIRYNSGNFRLNLNFVSSVPPANDACAASAVVNDGTTVVGSLDCAGNDGSATCGASATNPDVWYQFTAPTRGTLAASACGTRDNAGEETGPDAVLSAHSACLGNIGNQLVCNDDGFQALCDIYDSNLRVALAPAQNVRIRVSHFGSTPADVGNGDYTVRFDFLPCQAADSNCDGFVDTADIPAFVQALIDPIAYATFFPGCELICHNDLNGDGLVNGVDIREFLGNL